MKIPRINLTGQVRLWFWNAAGASSMLIPRERAAAERLNLIALGCVVWHTEVYA